MEHTKENWTIKEWTYKNGLLRKLMIQTDKDAVAEVLGLYRPDDLENKEMQANARLIADAPRLAEEVERITLALKSISEMVVTEYTDHAQLSALCIFVAKTALEGGNSHVYNDVQ